MFPFQVLLIGPQKFRTKQNNTKSTKKSAAFCSFVSSQTEMTFALFTFTLKGANNYLHEGTSE